LVGEGETKEEAIADFENDLQVAVEFYTEEGRELPEDLKDVEFEYKLVGNIIINND
jgi:predicted RNase H-like HicB family nuclease